MTNPFKKSHLIGLGIFVVAVIIATVWQYHWPSVDIILQGERLHVMVARTLAQQYKGLGGRSTLAPYDGMLFLFDESQPYQFVMRDMQFSIDIVWFENGEVVDIAPSLPLEPGATEATLRHYRPRKEANSVLELPAGWAMNHGLKIGDRVDVLSP